MVDVKKLTTFYDSCGPHATLCRDRRGRRQKNEGVLRFLICARDPLRRSACRREKTQDFLRFLRRAHAKLYGVRLVEALSLGRRANLFWSWRALYGVRVEMLSLWRRAVFLSCGRGLCSHPREHQQPSSSHGEAKHQKVFDPKESVEMKSKCATTMSLRDRSTALCAASSYRSRRTSRASKRPTSRSDLNC